MVYSLGKNLFVEGDRVVWHDHPALLFPVLGLSACHSVCRSASVLCSSERGTQCLQLGRLSKAGGFVWPRVEDRSYFGLD